MALPLQIARWSLVQNSQSKSVYTGHLAGIAAGTVATLLITIVCYWPSLSGPFLFDDIPNLELLGDRGELNSTYKYLEFITSAQSGPLGRPLSLASFTLDGQTWPTDPRPFRITNLVLHLVNGLLVFFLVRLLLLTVYQREKAEKLALLCAALWLLHPLLVSTTAYVIQRMTQLSCLFTLAGLICYMHARKQLPERPRRGWVWIIAGMGSCGALAVLSKENGILLPLYALLIEFTVLRTMQLSRRHTKALLAALCAPLLALAAYLTLNWESTVSGFEFRSFTLSERLWTQAAVLVDYLRQTVAPQLSGLGIIHDDYPVSAGLFSPVTLLSITVIAALLFAAMRLRKRYPFISLGILWFFAGHSLEAGPIPLELYFEHRNYLPLLGPLIAIVSLLPLLNQQLRRGLSLLLFLFIAMESFLTWQAAIPWGNENLLMQTALAEHPDSLRAQQHQANRHILSGQYAQALAIQDSVAAKFPEHASSRMSILNLRCILGVLSTEEIGTTTRFLEQSRYDLQIIGFLAPLVSNAAANTCGAFGFNEVQAVFDALLRNPVMSRNVVLRGATLYHKGIAYERSGDLDEALEQLNLSYAAKPEIDIRLLQIVWLLDSGKANEARHYLNLARRHAQERFIVGGVREQDLNTLQQRIDQATGAGH